MAKKKTIKKVEQEVVINADEVGAERLAKKLRAEHKSFRIEGSVGGQYCLKRVLSRTRNA